MKRQFKTLLITAVAGFAVFFAATTINSFWGNPISKQLAQSAAKQYLATQYPDLIFLNEEVFYNFKIGGYTIKVASPSSVDTHFELAFSMGGKLRYDSYDSVTSGWNTAQRLDQSYREMVETVVSASDFPLTSEIDFGTIEFSAANDPVSSSPAEAIYAIPMQSLILDQEYDIKELGQKAGHIIYYAADEDVSFEQAARLLLQLKEKFDQANVPFYAIDFILEKPRNADGTPNTDNTAIRTAHFLAADIFPDGLAQRLESNHNALSAYYAEQDAEKYREKPSGA